jgi:AcrR family transcriptional regulator
MAGEVLDRVVQRALSSREAAYGDEVRRLMDAALAVMVRRMGSSPRVADIVAEAGLSNDAFYRYFPSKGALIAALMDDGAAKLRSYLEHQMAKETSPEGRIRRWVEGVLVQASGDVATATRAVLWNGASADTEHAPGRHPSSGALAPLLHQPLTDLGSSRPELHARLVAHTALGALSDHLRSDTTPTDEEREAVVAFCLAAAHAGATEHPPAGTPHRPGPLHPPMAPPGGGTPPRKGTQ